MLAARKDADVSGSVSDPPRRSRTFPEILAWFTVDDIQDSESHSDVSDLNPALLFAEEQLHTPPLDPQNLDHSIRANRHDKSFYFQQDQLQDLAEQCRSGQKELGEICAEITDLAGRSLNPVEWKVTRY
jgi:hypothetical protein